MPYPLIRDYSTGERIGENYFGIFKFLSRFLSTIPLTNPFYCQLNDIFYTDLSICQKNKETFPWQQKI